MARLNKDEHEEILRKISETSNADPEMMDLIGRLRSDFDESLSVDLTETEKSWTEKYKGMVGERDRAIGERDEARRAYRERFFSNPQQEAEQIVNNQKEDSPRGTDYLLGITREEAL